MPLNTAKIGLYYGSSTCYTEMASEKIAQALAPLEVAIHNIADDDITQCTQYDLILMGIPTWDYGELQEDWEACWDTLDTIDFTQKTVALFGLGDQIGYPEWFLDAMGYLHNKLLLKGANLIGYFPKTGFEFEQSKALTSDEQYFVGLALDEENEFDLTEQRINTWVAQLHTEFDAQ